MPTKSNKKKAKEKEIAFKQAMANALQQPTGDPTQLSSYGQGFENPHPQEGGSYYE
jgi:hypothetical protein